MVREITRIHVKGIQSKISPKSPRKVGAWGRQPSTLTFPKMYSVYIVELMKPFEKKLPLENVIYKFPYLLDCFCFFLSMYPQL